MQTYALPDSRGIHFDCSDSNEIHFDCSDGAPGGIPWDPNGTSWNSMEFLGFRAPIPRAWVPPRDSGGPAEKFQKFCRILQNSSPGETACPPGPPVGPTGFLYPGTLAHLAHLVGQVGGAFLSGRIFLRISSKTENPSAAPPEPQGGTQARGIGPRNPRNSLVFHAPCTIQKGNPAREARRGSGDEWQSSVNQKARFTLRGRGWGHTGPRVHLPRYPGLVDGGGVAYTYPAGRGRCTGRFPGRAGRNSMVFHRNTVESGPPN